MSFSKIKKDLGQESKKLDLRHGDTFLKTLWDLDRGKWGKNC
jgi:hypothetical protein